MLEKTIRRRHSFHKLKEDKKPLTKDDYKHILEHKKLSLFTILISVIFWILIIIALSTPNYDLTKDPMYINMKIKYSVYISIFFFSALGMWGINAFTYIYGAVQIGKSHCQISKELLWLSILNIFCSVGIVFSFISLITSISFLKKHANELA